MKFKVINHEILFLKQQRLQFYQMKKHSGVLTSTNFVNSQEIKKIISQMIEKQRQLVPPSTQLLRKLYDLPIPTSSQKQSLIQHFKTHIDNIQASEIAEINKSAFLSARLLYVSEICDFQPIKQQIILESKLNNLTQEYKRRYFFERGLLRRQGIFQNYFYYKNRISQLHQKERKYEWLQRKHDYIQYMFPNHYQSMFNRDASPMDYYEVQLFRSDQQLGYSLFRSIQIFFDFMGLSLDKNDKINIIDENRLKDVLLVNYHNHLRIRRILACLSVTGFRHIAVELIRFLKQIKSQNPKFKRLSSYDMEQWEVYDDEHLQKALKLCFHPYQQFPDKNIFYQRNKDPQTKQVVENYKEHRKSNDNEGMKAESDKKDGQPKGTEQQIDAIRDQAEKQGKDKKDGQPKDMEQTDKIKQKGEQAKKSQLDEVVTLDQSSLEKQNETGKLDKRETKDTNQMVVGPTQSKNPKTK